MPTADYSESTLTATDGTALFVRHWAPSGVPARGQVLVLHGYMEHGNRYRELAHALCRAGLGVHAPDARGHGRSAGQRGYVRRFDDYLDDVEAVRRTLPPGPLLLLGHSHGGLVALDWAVARRPPLAGLVVTNPYLALALPAPPLKLWIGQQAARWLPRLMLPAGLDSAQLSADPAVVEAHRRDPLVFSTANAGWFGEVAHAQARVRGYRLLPVPLLYVFSDADPVAAPAASEALAQQLDSPDKEVLRRPGELHEVLNEVDRAALHAHVAAWMVARAGA